MDRKTGKQLPLVAACGRGGGRRGDVHNREKKVYSKVKVVSIR